MPQTNDIIIPYGCCHCGCGQKTRIAYETDPGKNWVKGEPIKYIFRHFRGKAPRDVNERFWEKVNKNGPIPECRPELGPCWLWTGALSEAGYGVFRLKPKTNILAHRFAYQSLVKPIPAELVPDHLCRTPACLNPGHLEPVTPAENVLRGVSFVAVNARKATCAMGHPLVAIPYKNAVAKRYCPICVSARRRRRYLAHAEEEKAYQRAYSQRLRANGLL